MKDILNDINDFITDPKGEDDAEVAGCTALLYVFGIIGWIFAYYMIYKYPIWIAFVC